MLISDLALTLIPDAECKRNKRENAESLSRFLTQYQFDKEWNLQTYHRDEEDDHWTPFTPELQKSFSEGLAAYKFRFPSGDLATITWMDFDGDGYCDFTASVGSPGMRPIQRVFLFRGTADGAYQLVLADHLYLEDSVAIVPFIPLGVSGEKLPAVLLGTGDGWNLFQWSPTERAFKACRLPKYGSFERPAHILSSLFKQTVPAEKFKQICEHIDDVGKWAESQLPHNNIAPRFSEEYIDSTCGEQASDATHTKQGETGFQAYYPECRLRFQ